jgi:hypothetical protein
MPYNFIKNVILNESTPSKNLELLPLPYSKGDLEPAISEDTINYNYSKLAKAYVDRYNDREGDLDFNEAGAFLHNILFPQYKKPDGKNDPDGSAGEFITKHFKTFANFKEKFGKEAMGSTKTVVNILENVMLQRDRAIRRAESIRIGQALYGLAIQYPNPDFWMAINPDAVKDIDALIAEMEEMGLEPELIANILEQPKTGYVKKGTGPEGEDLREVRYRIDRAYQNAKNVFPVRINGQNRYVLFNPKSKEALRMAAELKQLNPEQLNLFFGVASSFSRWFAAVNTQYNPVFGLVNFWNDTQGALINLSTTPLAGQQMTVMKNVLPALHGIARDIRKERKETVQAPIKTAYGKEIDSTDWSKLWRLYRDGGGKTAFRDQMVKPKLNMEWKGMMPSFSYTDSNTMLEALEKIEKGPVSKKVEWWADAFSDFNDTLENTIRLSVFKVAYLDNKLPVEPEGVVNPFRNTWSGKTYLGNYEERVAEIKNAITILNMCEEDTVNTSTYANVAKYL